MGNLTLHVEKLETDIARDIPDPHSSTLVILDWEAWRPLTRENDDGLSSYTVYSERLVKAEPQWANKNTTEIKAEAGRRFDAGARAFFTTTVTTIRRLRPNVRVGWYSQGINQVGCTTGCFAYRIRWDVLQDVSYTILGGMYYRMFRIPY
jgi:hypothetical protein